MTDRQTDRHMYDMILVFYTVRCYIHSWGINIFFLFPTTGQIETSFHLCSIYAVPVDYSYAGCNGNYATTKLICNGDKMFLKGEVIEKTENINYIHLTLTSIDHAVLGVGPPT